MQVEQSHPSSSLRSVKETLWLYQISTQPKIAAFIPDERQVDVIQKNFITSS